MVSIIYWCVVRVWRPVLHGRSFDLQDGDSCWSCGSGGGRRGGGSADPDRCHLDPTVVIDPDPSCALMTDEIFGPILPVVTYDDLDNAIAQIRSRPHPLALYLFSTNDDQIAQVTARTTSGGMLVNHTLLHLAAEDLPFGGVGESGMGAYHGQVGFDTFSHLRSVMRRPMRPDPSLMYPPYGPLARRLLRRVF